MTPLLYAASASAHYKVAEVIIEASKRQRIEREVIQATDKVCMLKKITCSFSFVHRITKLHYILLYADVMKN